MTPTTTGRRAKGRTTLVILALLSVLVMAASVLLAFILANRQVPVIPSETSLPAVQGGFTCDPAEAARLYPFGGGILKTDTSRISFLDMTGVEKWGFDCAMSTPACFSSGSVLVVADMSGSSYHVINSSGLVKQGNVPGTITGASAGAGGAVALVVEQPGNKGLVRVLSSVSGKESEWDFISRKSGFVLSAVFSPSGDWVDIATLDTDKHGTQTMIKRLDTKSGAQLAQFIPETGGVFPVVVHDEASNTVMVGTDSLIGYETNAAVAYNLTFFRIHRAVTTDRGVLVIAQKEPDGAVAAYLLTSKGALSTGLTLDGEVAAIAASGGKSAIAVDSKIYVIDLAPFSLTQVLGAGAEVLRLDFEMSGGIITVTQSGVGRLATGKTAP